MLLLYKIEDLFFRAKIEQIATASKTQFANIESAEELQKLLVSSGPSFVILDLQKSSTDVPDILGMVPSSFVFGYLSHVDKKLAQEMKGLGLKNSIPKSALEGILRKVLLQKTNSSTTAV